MEFSQLLVSKKIILTQLNKLSGLITIIRVSEERGSDVI